MKPKFFDISTIKFGNEGRVEHNKYTSEIDKYKKCIKLISHADYDEKYNYYDKNHYHDEDIDNLEEFIRKTRNDKKNNKLRVKAHSALKKICEEIPDKIPTWAQSELSGLDYDSQKKFLWTGYLLDIYGFRDMRFLGRGGFNIAWEDPNSKKVIKVCVEDDYYGIESFDNRSNNKIRSFLSKYENDKRKKYINKSDSYDNLRVYMSDKAKGDYSYLRDNKSIKHEKAGKKTLDSFLHNAADVLKAVILIHESGFSHNDIKPENFFKIEKSSEQLENKVSLGQYTKKEIGGKTIYFDKNGNKVNKNFLQLADFGGLTRIDDEVDKKIKTEEIPHTLWYWDSKSRGTYEKIDKRDMFSLGKSFIEMICRGHNSHLTYKEKGPEIETAINELWDSNLKNIYATSSESSVKNALRLSYEMIDPNPLKRPSYYYVLDEINALRGNRSKTKQKTKIDSSFDSISNLRNSTGSSIAAVRSRDSGSISDLKDLKDIRTVTSTKNQTSINSDLISDPKNLGNVKTTTSTKARSTTNPRYDLKSSSQNSLYTQSKIDQNANEPSDWTPIQNELYYGLNHMCYIILDRQNLKEESKKYSEYSNQSQAQISSGFTQTDISELYRSKQSKITTIFDVAVELISKIAQESDLFHENKKFKMDEDYGLLSANIIYNGYRNFEAEIQDNKIINLSSSVSTNKRLSRSLRQSKTQETLSGNLNIKMKLDDYKLFAQLLVGKTSIISVTLDISDYLD